MTAVTEFLAARDFLLQHRSDYATAYAGFKWPKLKEFNWALDYFDTLAKGKAFEVPLIRLGFPIFDRHHLHRMTTWGYEGGMYILTTLVNAVLERLDEETMILGKTDYNFDLVR